MIVLSNTGEPGVQALVLFKELDKRQPIKARGFFWLKFFLKKEKAEVKKNRENPPCTQSRSLGRIRRQPRAQHLQSVHPDLRFWEFGSSAAL